MGKHRMRDVVVVLPGITGSVLTDGQGTQRTPVWNLSGGALWQFLKSRGDALQSLRLAVHDPRREAIEYFTKQFAPLITSGPAGLAGYAAGRPQVRPVFAYWPTLVPKTLVPSHVEVRSAQEWTK